MLDAKRYQGKVGARSHGLFSRRPPDLSVGGRNQMKLVDGVKRQVETVEGIGIDGVWVGRGKEVRKRLSGQAAGQLPVADIAMRLARELCAG